MKKSTFLSALTTAFLLASCAEFLPAASDSGNATRAVGASEYYVLLQAEQTKLRDVANDGQNMYLDFAINVPHGMEFFDGEGTPIKAMIDGGLVGVPGVHSGLLVRLDKSMSFVSVRRGIKAENAPRVVESPQIKRMRERLVAEGPAKAAMLSVLSKIAKRSDIPVATADFKDRALAVQNEALPGKGAPGGSILASTLRPIANVPVDYASIDWRADAPAGAARSALINNSLGQKAYITFVGRTLQPVAASDVIGAVRWAANKEGGVVLVSGITATSADASAVLRAQQRAELVRKILVDEGVPKAKTSITAVFQTDTHRKANPNRPSETVGLTFLPESRPRNYPSQ